MSVPQQQTQALATIPVAQQGDMQRTGFGSTEVDKRAETASAAVAAQAKAAVEARYIMALRNPRNIDQARFKVLAACKRPRFAAVAIYRKPVGKGIEGPSIRMAEEIARQLGNILSESTVVYEDQRKRIVRVAVTDLETNMYYSTDITIEKTVERSRLREGQRAVAQRMNSEGRPVYIVEATDDDLLNKANAQISKALRTMLLRIIPADIVEEAMDQAYATRDNEDAKDPAAAKKLVVDAFAEIGVQPINLQEYLGHPLDTVSPAELGQLRGIYAAIRDGEATWAEVMDHMAEQRRQKKPEAATAAAANDTAGEQQTAAQAQPAAAQPPAAAAESKPATEKKGKPTLAEAAQAVKARREQQAKPAPAAQQGSLIDNGEEDEEERNRRAAEPTADEIAAREKQGQH